MRSLNSLKINHIPNLISLALFGSYGTEFWKKGKSDIDILILMEKRDNIGDEFDLEDILQPILTKYFNYDNVHLTFINMKSYDTIFARQYIDSADKLILNELKEIDFRLYTNKYLRENSWLIEKVKKDNKLLEELNGSLL